jgi:outer membrane lipoprotein SlyB
MGLKDFGRKVGKGAAKVAKDKRFQGAMAGAAVGALASRGGGGGRDRRPSTAIGPARPSGAQRTRKSGSGRD